MKKKIAPFTVSDEQKKWVEQESKRTGETGASVLRSLIQEKVNKEKRKK